MCNVYTRAAAFFSPIEKMLPRLMWRYVYTCTPLYGTFTASLPGKRLAAEDVNVQVMHRLTRVLALVDDEAEALRKPERIAEPADLLQHSADERRALIGELHDRCKVLLGHAQKMDLCLGRDVLEDDHLLVLVHLGGRDLARDDFTENAVFHTLYLLYDDGVRAVLFRLFQSNEAALALPCAVRPDADIIVRVAAVLFEHRLKRPAEEAGKIAFLRRRGDLGKSRHALLFDCRGKVGQLCGNRPRAAGIGKGVHARKPRLVHDGERV